MSRTEFVNKTTTKEPICLTLDIKLQEKGLDLYTLLIYYPCYKWTNIGRYSGFRSLSKARSFSPNLLSLYTQNPTLKQVICSSIRGWGEARSLKPRLSIPTLPENQLQTKFKTFPLGNCVRLQVGWHFPGSSNVVLSHQCGKLYYSWTIFLCLYAVCIYLTYIVDRHAWSHKIR